MDRRADGVEQTYPVLHKLEDWCRAEIAQAQTDAYRSHWQLELAATLKALTTLGV